MTRTVVVAGRGMAAHRFVADLRAGDPDRSWRLVVVGEEPRPAYDRVHLSSYLDGGDPDALRLAAPELAGDEEIERHTARRVVAVDRDARTVGLDDGTEIGYDALVLATGSRAFVPPVPGHDRPGCGVYRTVADLDALREAARPGRHGVVIGGGLLGLEAAHALHLLGMTPHVLEMAPHLMAAQLDAAAGAVLAVRVQELGLRVRCGVAVTSIDGEGTGGAVRAVTLADGTVIDTDLVVFCSGIRPRDELAESAGLARGERGGFLVDDRCATADPHVWAIGECAAVDGVTYGLAAPAALMAGVVARQLLGEGGSRFVPPDAATELKLVGVDVASLGDAHATGDDDLEVAYHGHDASGPTYAKLVLDADGRMLRGGVLAGDTAAYATLRTAVGRALPAEPETLLGR